MCKHKACKSVLGQGRRLWALPKELNVPEYLVLPHFALGCQLPPTYFCFITVLQTPSEIVNLSIFSHHPFYKSLITLKIRSCGVWPPAAVISASDRLRQEDCLGCRVCCLSPDGYTPGPVSLSLWLLTEWALHSLHGKLVTGRHGWCSDIFKFSVLRLWLPSLLSLHLM